ncbi:MAG: RNA methyltransferase [Bacteroidaceae bacterium]|nr:RNA methyltransferase [Bacteroidaceae bacterium]
MELPLTSKQNPRIKQLLSLQQKSSERRQKGLFVVEGRREVLHCMEVGYEVTELYLCPELFQEPFPASAQNQVPLCYVLPAALYEHIAYRGTTEGVIAIVRTPHRELAQLQLSENPLLVVLESVEKPGNLGAVLRSADAAGADAVVVCDPLTDLYNPNLIRASIGAIFTVPTFACSSQECIAFLQKHDIQILTAQLQDSHLYYDTDMRRPTAIVMGTESTGLTSQWREAATAHIRIPMLGRLDSLNVSVSSAILLYEAVRQRKG